VQPDDLMQHELRCQDLILYFRKIAGDPFPDS
jgi:hypothetical protein